MKIFGLSTLSALLTLPLLAAPATAAVEPIGPALVARYNFDGGAVEGKVSDLSGRGAPLALRGFGTGQVAILTQGTSRFAAFPGVCAATAPTCAKALLEAPDDADLDPGARNFKWAATVRISQTQLSGNANVMQKGVATTESQWKMQISGRAGRAQCVMVARGSGQTFSAMSTQPISDGVWHRLTCERVGGTLGVSVDGVAGPKVVLPPTVTVDNTMPMRIGGPNFAKDSDMYHGQIDDIYVQLG